MLLILNQNASSANILFSSLFSLQGLDVGLFDLSLGEKVDQHTRERTIRLSGLTFLYCPLCLNLLLFILLLLVCLLNLVTFPLSLVDKLVLILQT